MATLDSIRINEEVTAVLTLEAPQVEGQQVNTNSLNTSNRTLDDTTSPAVTKYGCVDVTLGASATEIDLTALADIEGNSQNCTGLKVQGMRVITDPDNDGNVTVGPGDTNGYDIFTNGGSAAGIDFEPDSDVLHRWNEQKPDVSASDKIIKISGTEGDIASIEVWLG